MASTSAGTPPPQPRFDVDYVIRFTFDDTGKQT